MLFSSTAHAKISAKERFFFIGDGKLHMKNVHNGKTANVSYFNQSEFDQKALLHIAKVFGYPQSSLQEPISLRLLAMLDHFSDHFAKNKMIYLTSGYRSPKYNQNLRNKGKTAAKTSTHIDGMALDFYIPGIDGKKMWEYIRHKNCCGAGHYGGRNIHLDAGRPRFWQQATAKVRSGASDYNRYIYLSSEFDRYTAQEKVRLFFTSISDFGFGVKDTVILKETNSSKKPIHLDLYSKKNTSKNSCLLIEKREDARFLYVDLPKKLPKGTYQLELEFCNKPFKEMPDQSQSNPIEVL